MNNPLQDQDEAFGNGFLVRDRQSLPERFGWDRHSSSQCLARVTKSVTLASVSLLRGVCRVGTRSVADSAIRNWMCSRYRTKATPSPRTERAIETIGKRWPYKGWRGSVTWSSVGSSGTGFLKGVLS